MPTSPLVEAYRKVGTLPVPQLDVGISVAAVGGEVGNAVGILTTAAGDEVGDAVHNSIDAVGDEVENVVAEGVGAISSASGENDVGQKTNRQSVGELRIKRVFSSTWWFTPRSPTFSQKLIDLFIFFK